MDHAQRPSLEIALDIALGLSMTSSRTSAATIGRLPPAPLSNCANAIRRYWPSIPTMSDEQDELAAVLQYLEEDERTALENGRNDLADRIATQRRRLLEPPPTDLGHLFNDIADELETTCQAAGIDDILTGDTITYIRKTAKDLDRHDR